MRILTNTYEATMILMAVFSRMICLEVFRVSDTQIVLKTQRADVLDGIGTVLNQMSGVTSIERI